MCQAGGWGQVGTWGVWPRGQVPSHCLLPVVEPLSIQSDFPQTCKLSWTPLAFGGVSKLCVCTLKDIYLCVYVHIYVYFPLLFIPSFLVEISSSLLLTYSHLPPALTEIALILSGLLPPIIHKTSLSFLQISSKPLLGY